MSAYNNYRDVDARVTSGGKRLVSVRIDEDVYQTIRAAAERDNVAFVTTLRAVVELGTGAL